MSEQFPTIEFDGVPRALAALEPYPVCAYPEFELGVGTVPRSEWMPISFKHYPVQVKDQRASNACLGFAASTISEIAQQIQGKPVRTLSPWFIYSQINGGRDGGAIISDAMTALQNTGICEDALVPYGVYLKNQIDRAAYAQARRFRMATAYQVRTWDGLCSALQLGWPVIFGIRISRNLAEVDAEGVSARPNQVIGGHAMSAVAMTWSSRLNEWLVDVQNSWGKRFGKDGYCRLRELHFGSWLDAIAVQTHADDPEDPNDEPPAVIL